MRPVFLLVLAVLFAAGFEAGARAQQEAEIDGLIIDETVSRIGQDFYRHFVNRWEPLKGIEDYNILINERANARWGSWISIKVNDATVYVKVLRSRPTEIEAAVEEGVSMTARYLLLVYQRERELETGDLAGSGIY